MIESLGPTHDSAIICYDQDGRQIRVPILEAIFDPAELPIIWSETMRTIEHEYDSIAECLFIDVQLNYRHTPYTAIIDTGSRYSCITQEVADELDLVPIGQKTMYTANGPRLTTSYFVDIAVSGSIISRFHTVSVADIPHADMLIGMDIISKGCLVVDSSNGRTTLRLDLP